MKLSDPATSSLKAQQYFAIVILFVSYLLFLMHQPLVLLVLFCSFHNIFLCQQASSSIHHSLQSAVNSIFVPGGTSLLFPLSLSSITHLFLLFKLMLSSVAYQASLALLSHIPPDMFCAFSFNGSSYKREVRRHYQNHPTFLAAIGRHSSR